MAMVACRVLLVVLLLGLYSISSVTGETLRLRGYLIPTDGSGRIVITDINPNGNNDVDALICQSELSTLSTGGNWFLHPTQQTTDDSYRIYATDTRGWHRNRVNIITAIAIRQLVRLRRDDSIASGGRALEGVFTCDIPGDRYTSVSVGIYYPITFVTVTINVESSRLGTFTVTCTAGGGTVVSSSLTGPGEVALELQPVGDIGRTGQNTYSVTSGTLPGRSNGDTYQCTAADNLSSPSLSGSEVLRVATDPTIVILMLVSSTTVRVEWSQRSGGASVTGYSVHYNSNNGVTNSVSGLPSTSTSHDITGLTSGGTYYISVEATTQHLSGESGTMTIILLPPPAAPEGVSVSEVQPHSVRVSWQAVEGADTYTVTFTQTMGDEQLRLCSDSHSVSVSTEGPSLSVVVGEDEMLRAFTTYSITVAAVSAELGRSGDSRPMTVTTAQTDSTAALLNFRATVQNSSSISVQWDRLTPCRDVNGLIVEFRVQYRELSSGPVQTLSHSVQSEMWNMPVEVSLTGLTPFTNYSIRAAPVNDQNQVGSYSGPVVTQTEEDAPGPVVITSSSPSFFKISITWDPPVIRTGIIIAYEVSYRPASAPQTITTMNTTDLDTSFTTQGRLELGTAYNFTVIAFTRAGRGEIATASISTLARPPAVRGVEVAALNATAVNVSWNALVIPDLSIDHYTVLYSLVESQRRRRQDGAMSAQFPSTTTSGVITGLDSTATYQFQVFATGTVDGTSLEGDRSSPVNFTIDGTTPEDGTDNGEDGTDNGEDGADNGEDGTDNGEDGADNGEDGTDNGEDGANNGKDREDGADKGSNVGGIVGGTIAAIIAVLAIVGIAVVVVCVVSRAVSGSKAGMATEDNPAYGVSDPHGKGDQTEHAYEMPEFIQPPPACHEAVYEIIN